MSFWEKPKEVLSNKSIRDFSLTILKLLLSLVVFFIAFGLIEGFEMDSMIQPQSFAKAFGFYLGLEIVTDALSKFARSHGLDDENVIELTNKLEDETQKVDREKGVEWVSEYNRKKRNEELKKLRMFEEERLLKKISKVQVKYDYMKEQPYKKIRIFKIRKRKKLKEKLERLRSLKEKIGEKNFMIKYEYIKLDDLLYRGAYETHKKQSDKKRFNTDAATQVKRVMRFKNMFQSVLLFGVQGFLVLSIDSGKELFLYFTIFIIAMATTGFSAYIYTYLKITNGSWLSDQKDKLKELKKMNNA